MPAPPNNSAYSDQPNDVTTARLTSVSIVAAACPSPVIAARCSGQAPQPATGAASSRLSHCQSVNCAAGTIATTITATASGAQTATRQPSARSAASPPAPSAPPSEGGAGRSASYPTDLTTPISSGRSRPPRLVKY